MTLFLSSYFYMHIQFGVVHTLNIYHRGRTTLCHRKIIEQITFVFLQCMIDIHVPVPSFMIADISRRIMDQCEPS